MGLLSIVFWLLAISLSVISCKVSKPNIVFIMADDLVSFFLFLLYLHFLNGPRECDIFIILLGIIIILDNNSSTFDHSKSTFFFMWGPVKMTPLCLLKSIIRIKKWWSPCSLRMRQHI